MNNKILVFIILSFSLTGCGLSIFTDPLSNPVIEDQIGPIFGEEKLATLATTSSRRTITVRLTDIIGNDSVEGMFCAEPSPDTAENFASSISSAIEASISQPGSNLSGSGKAEFAKALATSIQSLNKRSQGLQLYRDSAYQLCQALLNKAITKSQYKMMLDTLLTQSTILITKELDLTNGTISAPPAQTTLPKVSTKVTVEPGKTTTESTANP